MHKLLHLLPAESAHHTAIWALKNGLSPKINVPSKPVEVFGLKFENPVGMAAGFDKNAEAIDGLFNLGFGFVEAGTVTPRPQYGNQKPRMFRLPEDNAIINRLGFNNKGIDVFLENVSKAKRKGILGINIGANKDTEKFEEDYIQLMNKVCDLADYVTLNISSPNTPGLRHLQSDTAIESLVTQVKAARDKQNKKPPMLVKIAPDLSEYEIVQIVDVLISAKVDGIIATNTTLSREGLKSENASQQGGMSGKPLLAKATDVVKVISKRAGGKLPIVAVGGIFNSDDAKAKFDAGASLIQVYTGLIYVGPKIVRNIIQSL